MIQFDDVGMVEQLHHLNLTLDLLQVGLVQLALVDYLDCDLEVRKRRFETVCFISLRFSLVLVSDIIFP